MDGNHGLSLPEIPGDNPPLPDKCPACGAVVMMASASGVTYQCGAHYAPLPGIPVKWGGQCPKSVTVTGPNDPAKTMLNTMYGAAGEQQPRSFTVPPYVKRDELNAAIRKTITDAFGDCVATGKMGAEAWDYVAGKITDMLLADK